MFRLAWVSLCPLSAPATSSTAGLIVAYHDSFVSKAVGLSNPTVENILKRGQRAEYGYVQPFLEESPNVTGAT